MEAEGRKDLALVVDQIKEDERLEDPSEIAGAHQPGNEAVGTAL
jgi:hypothetical protein